MSVASRVTRGPIVGSENLLACYFSIWILRTSALRGRYATLTRGTIIAVMLHNGIVHDLKVAAISPMEGDDGIVSIINTDLEVTVVPPLDSDVSFDYPEILALYLLTYISFSLLP